MISEKTKQESCVQVGMTGNSLNYLMKSTFSRSELARLESSIRKKSAADGAGTGDSADLKACQRVAVDLDA
jgi:hypothetical protein